MKKIDPRAGGISRETGAVSLPSMPPPAPAMKRCAHAGAPSWAKGVITVGGADRHGRFHRPANLYVVLSEGAWVWPAPLESPDSRPVVPGWAALARYIQRPRVLSLAWDDGAGPPVDYSFWAAAWKLAQGEAAMLRCTAERPYHIVCSCLGGHGRTGAAMAALLVAGCGNKAEQAILFVRDIYCPDAVETEAQVSYLHALAESEGVQTQSETSRSKVKGSYNTRILMPWGGGSGKTLK